VSGRVPALHAISEVHEIPADPPHRLRVPARVVAGAKFLAALTEDCVLGQPKSGRSSPIGGPGLDPTLETHPSGGGSPISPPQGGVPYPNTPRPPTGDSRGLAHRAASNAIMPPRIMPCGTGNRLRCGR
jgi:hypothetical protein